MSSARNLRATACCWTSICRKLANTSKAAADHLAEGTRQPGRNSIRRFTGSIPSQDQDLDFGKVHLRPAREIRWSQDRSDTTFLEHAGSRCRSATSNPNPSITSPASSAVLNEAPRNIAAAVAADVAMPLRPPPASAAADAAERRTTSCATRQSESCDLLFFQHAWRNRKRSSTNATENNPPRLETACGSGS